MQVLQPASWPRPRGYSHGIAAQGTVVFVAGQIGTNPETGAIAPDFAGQLHQTLRNLVTVLREAGAGPEHLADMTWYVTDIAAYKAAGREIGDAWRETLGRNFPAITLVQVVALLDERALIEVSAHAVVPAST
jgi:enamine deaminase RidA (YjgF/YER057c/UK114 family)